MIFEKIFSKILQTMHDNYISYLAISKKYFRKWPTIFEIFENNPSKISRYTVYVTWHEKTGLMYTKYTCSYYGTYLLYCSQF